MTVLLMLPAIVVTLCIPLIWFGIEDLPGTSEGGFDWTGLVAMAVFLGSMEYVMEEGPRWDWLDDPTIATLAAACLVSALVFFWRAFTRRDPIVELRAYGNANFAFGSAFAFIIGIGLYGAVYLIPVFLGRVRGYNSLQIGETMFITGFAMFLAAPVVGRLSRSVDLRLLLAFGIFIEPLPGVLVLVPILAPMAAALGIDPLHFAIVVIVNLTLGMITPPVGSLLFVTALVANVRMTELNRELWPMLGLQILVLALITLVPGISLSLPRLLGSY